MGGGAIPVDYQQQMSECCNEPITSAITEPEETLNSSGNDSGGGGRGEAKKNSPVSTEDYFYIGIIGYFSTFLFCFNFPRHRTRGTRKKSTSKKKSEKDKVVSIRV